MTHDINHLEQTLRKLENAGLHGVQFNLDASGTPISITLEDPGCVIRSFETFMGFAWTILGIITIILLAGWAWAMIRGSKNAELKSIANNFTSLVLIFCTISIVPAIIYAIYGQDLIKRGCKTFEIPMTAVEEILDKQKTPLNGSDAGNLYEYFDIYDSALDGPAESNELDESEEEEELSLEMLRDLGIDLDEE